MKKFRNTLLTLLLALCTAVNAFAAVPQQNTAQSYNAEYQTPALSSSSFSLSKVPAYSGKPSVKINGNKPYFKQSEYKAKSFEKYGALDRLGRCTTAYACIGKDIMPTEKRGSIGMVRPTGWHTVKYDCVSGKYLYNRCHLIAYELAAENANERNLITGTRYMNVDGMLPYENQTAEYVKTTGNHVLYRVTPVFKGSELVARGVLIEAASVEDNGKGLRFCVYCYNVQPKIEINYANGNSRQIGGGKGTESNTSKKNASTKYIANTNTKVFHRPTCASVKRMSEKNKQIFTGARSTLIGRGYSPCKVCKP